MAVLALFAVSFFAALALFFSPAPLHGFFAPAFFACLFFFLVAFRFFAWKPEFAAVMFFAFLGAAWVRVFVPGFQVLVDFAFYFWVLGLIVWAGLLALAWSRDPQGFAARLFPAAALPRFGAGHLAVGRVVRRLEAAEVSPWEAAAFFRQGFALNSLSERREKQFVWRDADAEFSFDPLLEANPHVSISGVSGYGKSTLCRVLVSGIVSKGFPVVVLDVHGEYSSLVRGLGGDVFSALDTGLGVWGLDGESPREKIAENVSIIDRVMKLGDVQAYYLAKCAERAYAAFGFSMDARVSSSEVPSMRDVAAEADSWIRASRFPDRSLVGMRRRLEMLALAGVFDRGLNVEFSRVLSRSSCFGLAGLRSGEAQAVYIEVFLRKLYAYMVREGLVSGVRLFVLIDEAQNVCVPGAKEPSFAGKICAEARKYGIGLIASSQMARDIDRAIIGNAAVTFAFYQKEPGEAQYVIGLMAGPDYAKQVELNRELSRLGRFECLCVSSGQRMPVVVRVGGRALGAGTASGTVAGEAGMSGRVPANAQGGAAGRGELLAGVQGVLARARIRAKRYGGVRRPDFVVERSGRSIAIQVDCRRLRADRVRRLVSARLRSHALVVLVVPPPLKGHFAEAVEGIGGVEVVSVAGLGKIL
ncbi:MAG: ATP-binding protein [Candidatus Diapherotrites archaeon]|uniref:ATP-binding protein n=1 Tax=Candidatus Iainarchaeum sp. TaxID=3101447 RepID=A0A8T3YN73_9ARCH|nr:ATP-binding protein [Candidatus Diapherotrites archaeon]